MNAYYNESNIRSKSLSDRTTDMVCTIIDFLTNAKIVSIVKIAITLSALFGFVATVGMVDNGSIGFFLGAIICTALSLVEIAVIGSMTGKAQRK